LFDGAIVEQHFDVRSGRRERFTGRLRDPSRLDRLAGRPGKGRRMLGLAVEAGTGLVVQADRLDTVGAGSAHVFIKSLDQQAITWHTLSSGDKAMLQRNGRGKVELVAGR
jgi:cyanophycinase-like exopeptidase